MKFQKLAFTMLLMAFSSTTFAEGYVGAGSGGPLLSTNGCVMSSNGVSFPECGGAGQIQAATPAPTTMQAPQPRIVTRVIVDCSRCNQAKRPSTATQKIVPKKQAARKAMPGKASKTSPKPVVRYGKFRKYNLRPKSVKR